MESQGDFLTPLNGEAHDAENGVEGYPSSPSYQRGGFSKEI